MQGPIGQAKERREKARNRGTGHRDRGEYRE